MRCHEARQRIEALRGGELSYENSDRELREHLRSCPECAAFAQAERNLARDFAAAGIDDNDGGLPLSIIKTRAEARAQLAPSEPSRETNLMSTIFSQMKKRPRLGMSISIAVVLLAIATLVPFKFQDTIGYDVAIAGVNKDLAMDSTRINELLIALGLGDVDFDVSDCEVTCKLKLSDLKTEDDVQMVIAAFDELGNCELKEITPEVATAHVSLIKHVHGALFDGDTDLDNEDLHQIVIERLTALGSDSAGVFTIWVDKDSCTGIGAAFNVVSLDSSCLGALDGSLMLPDGGTQIEIKDLTDGTSEMTVITADGETHVIDLNAEDAAEQLEALGLDATMLNGDLGGGVAMFITTGDCGATVWNETEDEGDGAAKTAEETVLPEGYTLEQNYPNPFNPTTQISYSVPVACHALLEIYNIQGQKVRTLVDQAVTAGDHTVEWDATADDGKTVATGAYFYRLTAGEVTQSKKMMFMK